MQHTVNLHQKSETFNLKDVYMLDSGSTIPCTIANKNLACNFRDTEIPMLVSTNGGEVFMNKEGDTRMRNMPC